MDRPDRTGRATDDPAFDERQSLPSWLGPALVALSLPAIPIAAVAVLDAEGPTLEAIALVAASVLAPISLVLRSTLRTTVREDGVYVRFSPIHRSDRRIAFDEIRDVRRSDRRAYQYGIRRTRWGWEYRPNASEGVEIYREEGSNVFLGSERPRELRTAIETGIRRC